MRIVDLRPWPIRMALGLWGRNRAGRAQSVDSPSAAVTESDGGWTGGLMARFMDRRDRNRPAWRDQRPFLLSVGNLALGGTGKTPVVGALARDLADRGLSGGILTRGYGSDLRGPLVVDASDSRAGDEARWHASQTAGSGWIVVQARSRPRGLRFLLEKRPDLDIVLLEDAHQTAGLARHLDLLILDRWASRVVDGHRVLQARTGSLFPLGPYRESARGARRAGIFLVETADSVPALSETGKPVATFRRQMTMRTIGGAPDPASDSTPWAALSGIAHPEAFERAAEGVLGLGPVVAIRCSDHKRFTPALVERIRREMHAAGAVRLVTTAKDWVKLEELWPPDERCLVADLRIEWGQGNALPDLVEERVRTLPER